MTYFLTALAIVFLVCGIAVLGVARQLGDDPMRPVREAAR